MPRNFERVSADEAWQQMNGGSLQGYVRARPADLVSVFGDPDEGDGYKISGEFYFRDPDNPEIFFYVYDWKQPIFRSSRSMHEEYRFHIGGQTVNKQHLADFQNWLLSQLRT